MYLLLILPLLTAVVAGWSYGSWRRGLLFGATSIAGPVLGLLIWVVPGSYVVGGHFEGAWYFLLLPLALTLGYVAGVLIPLYWLGKPSIQQSYHRHNAAIERPSDD